MKLSWTHEQLTSSIRNRQMSFDTGNSEISAEMEFLKYPTQLPKRKRKLYHWGNPY